MKKVSFASVYPQLIREWHPVKNGKILPEEVAPKSGKKVWWLCDKGHEWEATIASRADGRGCPICNKERQTSFPEQAIFYYVSQVFPDAINGDVDTIGLELDIYIPSIKYAIEYDGYRWHHGKAVDEKKNELCINNGIKLIRVREEGLSFYDNCTCIKRTNRKEKESLNDVVVQILTIIGATNINEIDITRDETDILNLYIRKEKEKSFGTIYPDLSKEWHPTKNGFLSPYSFSCGSKRRVWWLGKCGHEWQAGIIDRVNGNGCPFCSNRSLLKGYNDLATRNAQLAEEWSTSKNGALSPENVLFRSRKKVWWKGKCGHEWQATVVNRYKGSGCPFCSGNKVLRGFNDLRTVMPQIAEEWDYKENNGLLPEMVTSKSNRKVGWICAKGHTWKAKVFWRANGNGCPYCSGNKCMPGVNDINSANPELASEWHPSKNGDLTPKMVTKGSGKKVWWLGKCGHEWQATIGSRMSGKGCPICSSTCVVEGINDLSTLCPELASEWNYKNNKLLKPTMLMPQSNKKVWWLGKCGHEWCASIASRFNGNGCPVCNSKIIQKGVNDFANSNPELAKEWHPSKNGTLLPTEIARTSHKKVWWLGKCGHEWQDSVAHRYNGRKCPICANRKILIGFNDLAYLRPDLASEWDEVKNNPLTSQMVTMGSNKKVWWKGKCGHEWQATIKNRCNGTGCPLCKNLKVKK